MCRAPKPPCEAQRVACVTLSALVRTRTVVRRSCAALLAVAVGIPVATSMPASPALAAAASVGNGITTTDLSAPGMTPLALATALVGTGVTVSNATFTGLPGQAGLVHVVDPAVVSFNDGVILSSGNVADIVGPNKSDGTTGDMGQPGDSDLDAIITGTQTVDPHTYDAAVLEFDFVPASSPIYFTYTFGSDEYLEWVNLFNDVFAFYVNGTNCATIPSGEAVSINTINSAVNPSAFRDNSFSAPPNNPINIESDGLSVELICTAPVNVGTTNHLKMAIADTSDHILDSVVMMKSSSLSTQKPESCNDGVDNDDDDLIDDGDDSCTSTTTPAPVGSGGVGSDGKAPAFTGNAGYPIVLDAAAVGWVADPEAASTSWDVHGINGTDAVCSISPAGKQAIAGGVIAVVEATCPVAGEYVAQVEGWDIEGGSAFDYDVDFFVHNGPPALSLMAPTPTSGSSVEIGATVELTASLADDSDGDTLTCTVDWGDGSSESGSVADGECTASHAYTATGWVKVGVVASDASGASSAAALALQVVTAGAGNNAPSAAAGGPYSGAEGSTVTLTGTASDADDDTLTVQWSAAAVSGVDTGAACTFGAATALATTVECTDDGTYLLTLAVSDGAITTTKTASLTVSNESPAVSITAPAAPATVRALQELTLSTAVTDEGANDTQSCSIDWGDSTASSTPPVSLGSCTGTHTFATAGSYTVTVVATDDDGSSSSSTVAIGVAALPSAVRGNREARLSWDRAAWPELVTVTDYLVERSINGGRWIRITDGVNTRTSVTFKLLVNGKRYRYRIAARNKTERGTWLETGTVVPSTVPGAPLALVVKRTGSTAKISWRAPLSNGGAPVTDYRIQYSTDRSTWTDVAHDPSTLRSITVADLPTGVRCWFRVAAVNLVGQGRYSAVR